MALYCVCAGVGEHRPVYDALHVSALRWAGLNNHHALCDVQRNRPHQTEKEPQGACTCRCVHFPTSLTIWTIHEVRLTFNCVCICVGVEDGQTVRMSLGNKQVYIMFRVSLPSA